METVKPTKEEILKTLRSFAVEIIGADIISESEIELENTLSNSLEMDSIEIVAFFEKIKTKYGSKINIQTWLSQKDLQEIINLKIADVVNYIDECL